MKRVWTVEARIPSVTVIRGKVLAEDAEEATEMAKAEVLRLTATHSKEEPMMAGYWPEKLGGSQVQLFAIQAGGGVVRAWDPEE